MKTITDLTGNAEANRNTFKDIASILSQGEDVNIPGFGKFSVTERAARVGRNPKTGETIQVAASKKVSFKPAKALKEAV